MKQSFLLISAPDTGGQGVVGKSVELLAEFSMGFAAKSSTDFSTTPWTSCEAKIAMGFHIRIGTGVCSSRKPQMAESCCQGSIPDIPLPYSTP